MPAMMVKALTKQSVKTTKGSQKPFWESHSCMKTLSMKWNGNFASVDIE
jgi:hypothetical protein